MYHRKAPDTLGKDANDLGGDDLGYLSNNR